MTAGKIHRTMFRLFWESCWNDFTDWALGYWRLARVRTYIDMCWVFELHCGKRVNTRERIRRKWKLRRRRRMISQVEEGGGRKGHVVICKKKKKKKKKNRWKGLEGRSLWWCRWRKGSWYLCLSILGESLFQSIHWQKNTQITRHSLLGEIKLYSRFYLYTRFYFLLYRENDANPICLVCIFSNSLPIW